ncbi:hypothetical protein FEDK69T_17360 [Flavobacterium enshiense DK69]|nr:hypothetical protein FEDK69T_17360 [Flavobacterium enshiense DK69]
MFSFEINLASKPSANIQRLLFLTRGLKYFFSFPVSLLFFNHLEMQI